MKKITWGGVQCRFVEKQSYFYKGDGLKYLLYEIEVKLIYLKWRKILTKILYCE